MDVVEYRQGLPAVNVKVYRSLAEEVRLQRDRDEFSGAFLDWVVGLLDAEYPPLDDVWECATGGAWDDLAEEADHVFGPGVEISQAGRSGGWCVVSGIGDPEDWATVCVRCGWGEGDHDDDDECEGFRANAERMNQWDEFEVSARNLADDVPYSMLTLLYLNDWDRLREEREELASRFAHLPLLRTA